MDTSLRELTCPFCGATERQVEYYDHVTACKRIEESTKTDRPALAEQLKPYDRPAAGSDPKTKDDPGWFGRWRG